MKVSAALKSWSLRREIMKIERISKTFYNKVLSDRKHGMRWERGIFFIAADGFAYRTYSIGPGEVKAVHEFKKKIKIEVEGRPQPVGLFEEDC